MIKASVWLGLALALSAPAWAGEEESKTAVSDLYPNDMGPEEIDVSSYPKDMKEKYKIFKFKCAACHTIARPINSQFLELPQAELDALKKSDPKALEDDRILHADPGMWNRYVKRMMAKPGCPVGKDGKAIWEFLAYDSKVRKTGEKAAEWRALRLKLLADYKKDHAEAFKKLYGEKPLPKE